MANTHIVPVVDYFIEASRLGTLPKDPQNNNHKAILAIGKVGCKELEYQTRNGYHNDTPGKYDPWRIYCDELEKSIGWNPRDNDLMVVVDFVFHIEVP